MMHRPFTPLHLRHLVLAGVRQRRAAVLLTAASLGLCAALIGLGGHALVGVAARTQPATTLSTIVVGAPGDPLSLAMCAGWFLSPCKGRLSAAPLEALAAEPSVRAVVPFATGDAAEGAPVVATVAEAFRTTLEGPGLRLAAGGPLSTSWEAMLPWLREGTLPVAKPMLVVGSRVAERRGLDIGDTIALQHGAAGPAHGPDWTVTGVLAQTGTSIDNVIFADLGAFVAMDDHQGVTPGVSGAWLRPRGGVHKAILRARLGANPAVGHADLLVERQRLLDALGLGARGAAMIALILLSMVGFAAAAAAATAVEVRRRELALLVMLGAQRQHILRLLLGEAALIGFAAGALGALLGRLLWTAAQRFAAWPAASAPLVLPELTLAAVFAGLHALAVFPTAWSASGRRAHTELGAAD